MIKHIKKLGLIGILAAALIAGPMPEIKATGTKQNYTRLEQVLSTPSADAAESKISMTGTHVQGMENFDYNIPELMAKWKIPGGAIAVVKDGKLVFVRGYGLADKESNQPVQPDSLFRIGSVSKSITAVGVLKLVEEGKLDLDAKAFLILDNIKPIKGTTLDNRIYDITVRHLLQHSGGWDRELENDVEPLLLSEKAAKAAGTPAPASAETIIRYVLGQPLQFKPGTKYAYSNFGYCVLGRIIEKVTGQRYEDYIKNQILNPAGITRIQQGRTSLKDRLEGEVRYYDGNPSKNNLAKQTCMESMDSYGGWIASTSDLMRFLTVVDGLDSRPDILQPTTIEKMISRPESPLWVGSPYYYGLGWNVKPRGDDTYWWHQGYIPGSNMSLLVKSYNGLAWTVLFNCGYTNGKTFFKELDDSILQALKKVTKWPAYDLFNQSVK